MFRLGEVRCVWVRSGEARFGSCGWVCSGWVRLVSSSYAVFGFGVFR